MLEPSADRVEAPCRHFGDCGGCRFQDLAYEAPARGEGARRSRDALVPDRRDRRPAARADRPGRVALPLPEQARVLVHADARTGRRSASIVPDAGTRCSRSSVPAHDRARQRDPRRGAGLGARGAARGVRPGDAEGYLRHLVVREGRNTGQALVVLVTAPASASSRGYLVEVLRRFPEVRSIHWAVNDTPAEVTNLPTPLLWGEDAIEEELSGLRFRVRPNAFLQTNTEMAERLYALAREYAALTGGETVYDLYCGTGTIGLSLAGRRADGVGRRDLRGVGRVRDRERRAERDRERGLLRGQRRPVARGAARAGRPARRRRRRSAARGARGQGAPAASASCRRRGSSTSPATRRRSPATSRCCATSYGYELVRCRPVDMFPHTPHVESGLAAAPTRCISHLSQPSAVPNRIATTARLRAATTEGARRR